MQSTIHTRPITRLKTVLRGEQIDTLALAFYKQRRAGYRTLLRRAVKGEPCPHEKIELRDAARDSIETSTPEMSVSNHLIVLRRITCSMRNDFGYTPEADMDVSETLITETRRWITIAAGLEIDKQQDMYCRVCLTFFTPIDEPVGCNSIVEYVHELSARTQLVRLHRWIKCDTELKPTGIIDASEVLQSLEVEQYPALDLPTEVDTLVSELSRARSVVDAYLERERHG